MSGISNDPEYIKVENEEWAGRVEHHMREELAYHMRPWPDEAEFQRLEETYGIRIDGVFNHERAGTERRHEVYERLTRALTLNERDAEKLEGMGIDKESAVANGYRSVPTLGEASGVMEKMKDLDFRGVPGFYQEKGEDWKMNLGEWKDEQGAAHSAHQGLLVPVRNVEGRISGFQIDRAEAAPGEPKQIWFSSIGKENGASMSVVDDFADNGPFERTPEHYRNIDETRRTGVVLITEGALKADTASELLGGKGAVGVADLRNIPGDFGDWLKAGIPEARLAVIVMDSDFRNSSEGNQALVKMSESLSAAGIESKALDWNERQGNSLEEYLSSDKENRGKINSLLNEAGKSIRQSHDEARTVGFGIQL